MQISFKFTFILSLFFVLSLPNLAAAQTDSSNMELNIFPNPNRGNFYITVINDASYQSELYSMDGRLVKAMPLQSGLNYYSVQVPAGIYILKVGEGELLEEFKIVIK